MQKVERFHIAGRKEHGKRFKHAVTTEVQELALEYDTNCDNGDNYQEKYLIRLQVGKTLHPQKVEYRSAEDGTSAAGNRKDKVIEHT